MRFFGIVGFWIDDVETTPGVFKPQIVEKKYVGDIRNRVKRWQENDQQNDYLKINNTISIVSDVFARQNYTSIKYVICNGRKLKVNSVTIDYPRLTLEIGGDYNGTNSPNPA